MHDPTAGKPLISVIITSYNYLRFITTAIDSARAQTYPNLEIVVVDNCSTDGTVPALRERYAGDPRVRIYENERNLGELLNSNRGFEHSTGAFVMWLSADDWMYPQHLARSHRLFERAPQLDVVYSGAYFADEAGTVYTQRMPEAIFPFDYVDARDELVEMFTTTCPMCWPTALFRRSVFLDVGLEHPEDGIHATDWEMQIRIALAGKRFGYLVEPSLAIRIHEAQQTGAGYHTGGHRLTDLLLMFEKYIDHPGLERLRGREAAVAGFFGWVVDDTIAASGRDVFPPEVHARIATVKRVFEERAARYEPAQVHERKISVVLASTRSPVLTARAIASVAAQTHPNWEIVLVDAGALPLESWLDGLPERERISYVRATMPLTPGGRRNLALRMARGEYLAFLGESNVYAPGHLAALAGAAARSGARAAA
jgi:glycosyltransferase involved in cell wall biosynthesis